MAKITIETELGTKQFERQIENLRADLNRYMKTLESDAKVPISLRMSAEERRNLETTIEKTRNQLISLEQQAQKVGESGEEAGERSGRGFDKGIRSLKRFSLGLFGIRTAFSLITRASNSYLAQNETTANKLNAIWVALGNALGPIIEIIADGILKLIGYLNVFLNALGFKVDLTKNMNKSTKAIKGTSKAMKELNNQMASFDEAIVQQKETSTGGVGGGADGTNGFTMPELDPKIVKSLEESAKWLKENWQYLVAIGAVIGTFKIAKWLSGISSLIGGGTGAGATGLLGLHNILLGLLAIEAIAITISVIYYGLELNKLKKINEEVSKFYQNNVKNSKKVNDNNLEVAKSYEKGSEEIDKYVNELNNQIETSKDIINAKEKEKDSIQGLDKVWDAFGGTTRKANEIQESQIQNIINLVSNMQELANEGKLTEEQMKTYNKALEYLDGTHKQLEKQIAIDKVQMGNFATTIDSTKVKLYDQITALQKLNNTKARPTIEFKADTRKLSSVLDTLSNSNFLGSTVTTSFASVSNKLKNIGLARGSIVNLPGKGVPLSNIYTGEATGGAEGILPMNNEQSMELMGEAVARHVVINLTNVTELDGKVIAREQRKIQDSTNFATNGRGV